MARERERSEAVLERLLPLLAELEEGVEELVPGEVVHHPEHSNDLLEVELGGRRLMVKRGVEAWSGDDFRSARRAARLLRSEAGVEAPRYLDLPEEIAGWPILAWWRIPRAILADAWPGLSPVQRDSALRSWGRLLRRLHRIRVSGWGPLARIGSERHGAASFLWSDLGERLRPAITGTWPEGLSLVDALLERLDRVEARTGRPRLVHHDPHLSNVLCEVAEEGVNCVGLVDLEAARGGAAEDDLAYLRIIHSPLVSGSLGDGWFRSVVEGYGREPDPELLGFFRVYHLVNLGFDAARKEWDDHAGRLADAAREEVGRW